MTPEFLTGLFFEAIKIAIMLAAPMLLAGLVVGLAVSIFQSVTSALPRICLLTLLLIFANSGRERNF